MRLFFAWIFAAAFASCDRAGPAVPWKSAELESGADVARALAGPKPPSVVHVGPEPLFRRGHLPGAKYAGAAGSAEGLAKLAEVAAALPKDREVVVYCGCCPWDHCPNIRPAYTKLASMGLTVRVLDMPRDFHADWESKGLPVEK